MKKKTNQCNWSYTFHPRFTRYEYICPERFSLLVSCRRHWA